MARRSRKFPLRKLPVPVLILLAALLALYWFWPRLQAHFAPMPSEGSTFEVHFIDVGQADAALVLCDDQAMLIDGGNAEDSDLLYSYLRDHGIRHLDYVVCTHAHEDHVGGLAGALAYATVGTAYCPVDSYDSRAFDSFVRQLTRQEVAIKFPPRSFSLGSAQVTVLGPVMDYDDTNNTSIVLRIDYGETSFLFTGDAEQDAEEDMLAAGQPLRSTVLKVGHHGSDTSSSSAFLLAVEPQYAVISVGEDNAYDHPSPDVLSRLAACGAEVYRTDLSGDIICTSDGRQVHFQTER